MTFYPGDLWTPHVGVDTTMGSELAFSPDSALLAAIDQYGLAQLWEVSTGQVYAALEGYTGAVTDLAFSPDCALLATGYDDGTLRIWDMNSDQPRNAVIEAVIEDGFPPAGMVMVEFNPDGTMLASVNSNGLIRLWTIAGDLHTTFQGDTEGIMSAALSPDGTLLVTGGFDGLLQFWEISNSQIIPVNTPLESGMDSVYEVAFSPDGTLLAIGGADSRGKISLSQIWDVSSNQFRATLVGGPSFPEYSFSPNGDWLVSPASSSPDVPMHLWEVSSGQLRSTFLQPTSSSSCPHCDVAFSPDGTLLVLGSKYITLRMWGAENDQFLPAPQGHGSRPEFCSDGTLYATGGGDGTVRIWGIPGE